MHGHSARPLREAPLCGALALSPPEAGPRMGPLQNPDRFQDFLTHIGGNSWCEAGPPRLRRGNHRREACRSRRKHAVHPGTAGFLPRFSFRSHSGTAMRPAARYSPPGPGRSASWTADWSDSVFPAILHRQALPSLRCMKWPAKCGL